MTDIIIFRNEGRIVGFKAIGHSGYAPHGEDIVCAAISALTQSAVNGLLEVACVKTNYIISEGFIACRIDNKKSSEQAVHDAEIILGSMYMGLKSIGLNYGNYLKITEREV